jgi:hypothetical protein
MLTAGERRHRCISSGRRLLTPPKSSLRRHRICVLKCDRAVKGIKQVLLEFDGEARFQASQSADHPSTEVPGRPTMSRHLLQSPDSLAPAQLPPSGSNALAEWKIARGLRDVFEFSQVLLEQPTRRSSRPVNGHWEIFERLCRESKATGNLVQDALLRRT